VNIVKPEVFVVRRWMWWRRGSIRVFERPILCDGYGNIQERENMSGVS
jgi:hypothetical protein